MHCVGIEKRKEREGEKERKGERGEGERLWETNKMGNVYK